MRRRDLLLAGLALTTPQAPAFARAPLPSAARAHALYAALFTACLDASPETATALGLDRGAQVRRKHRLDERGYADRFDFYDVLADARGRIGAIDRRGLDAREGAWLDTVRWAADIAGEFRRFAYGGVGGYAYPVPYVVSQLSGAYQSVPDFLDSQHTIETRADCEAYVDRLAAFARAVDQETVRVRQDAMRGVSPPGFLIDRALKQLGDLRAQHGASAGLVASLVKRAKAKSIPGDWEARAVRLVDGPLAAALERQIAALQVLRPGARASAGVRDLPEGEAYYAMCLKFQTSTGLTPDQAHAIGLEQVAGISARAEAILKAQGLTQGTVAARITALGEESDQLFPNTDPGRAQVLDYIRGKVADMKGRLPQVFATLPKTPLEVRRVPPEIELGSPGAYSQSGSLDGTRPGAIYFNLHDTANWPKWQIPTTVYHESLPGHHLQGSLVNEARGTPGLMKLLGFNAYNEGWALYAEQLADEIGVYDSEPLGRLGMLQASLFRACRIVVDTGMHAKGWSREQAIAYLIDNAGSTPDDARREIERYCAWPGQACGYKIGHLEMVRIREDAKARLGAKFDLKGFHDAVLLGGSMPLEVVRKVVDAWVKRRGA